MRLQILGLNHNTAPVEIREKVVFAGDEVGRALTRLSGIEGVEEAVLLSTCNRTEFYIVTSDGGRDRQCCFQCAGSAAPRHAADTRAADFSPGAGLTKREHKKRADRMREGMHGPL